MPVVFCQVPDLEVGSLRDAYGVASLPPLELQLAAWRRLAPSLGTIGLVLGRDEHVLALRARRAADALGLVLHLQLASSDQEALYHMRRMVPEIDGLWLLPDNAVLSPRAIREMLDHAGSRGVQTLVFTPSLLEWGALLSVAATPTDLADALARIIDELLAGRATELPPLSSLSELEARVNAVTAAQLGVAAPQLAWIERSTLP